MQLPRALVDEIVAQARRAAPGECCGLIGGTGDQAQELYPVRNVAKRNDRFRASLPSRLRASWRLWRNGQRLLAVYHSHPRGEAYPSRIDIGAARPGQPQLIVSLSERAIRAFDIRDGRAQPLPISLT